MVQCELPFLACRWPHLLIHLVIRLLAHSSALCDDLLFTGFLQLSPLTLLQLITVSKFVLYVPCQAIESGLVHLQHNIAVISSCIRQVNVVIISTSLTNSHVQLCLMEIIHI